MRATASRSLQADINVTPLVDVCLVLLIIFMIVLPNVVNGLPVALPETKGGDDLDDRILPLTIKADGTVYVDANVVRADEIASALQRLHATSAARPIAVRADKRVAYGEVMAVLTSCRAAGWQDVSLVGMVTNPTASEAAATRR